MTVRIDTATDAELYGDIDQRYDAGSAPSLDQKTRLIWIDGDFQLNGGIIGTLAFMDFHDLPDSYLTEYLARLEGVTPGQVNDIAASQWPADGMTIVVVGDRSVIDEQLARVEALAPFLAD